MKKLLNKSPINYFSDLFVAAMVIGWLFVLLIMIAFAVYCTIVYADTALWTEISGLVTIPLSCGGAIWMIKNCVQHAIANSKGESVPEDFPKVNADGEDDGIEEEYNPATEETEEPKG